MKSINIEAVKSFDIEIDDIATDKSISHRCAMFSLLSDRASTIKNYLQAEDTLNSLNIAKLLGATVNVDGDITTIIPPKEIKEPSEILDCGNSGTSIRLYAGLLAGLDGFFILDGDKYLRKRPMKRVTKPLSQIGASLDGRDNGNLAPIAIRGGNLKRFDYDSKISSAQVKSALILAALKGDGVSSFSEPELSRDHTERMLKGMGANIEVSDKIYITPMTKPLDPLEITVPSDPSSGFFFAVAAVITPNSRIILKNMLLNKTRIEAYKVLERMGANIKFAITDSQYEDIGDIEISYSQLKCVVVDDNISWLIDELPALSIAMSLAEGESIVRNAKELRVKESDRISSVVTNLKKCGIEVEEFEDGYKIVGSQLKKSNINSFGDHRIAMSFIIAGLRCGMSVDDVECIYTSFPNFFDILNRVRGGN